MDALRRALIVVAPASTFGLAYLAQETCSALWALGVGVVWGGASVAAWVALEVHLDRRREP